MIIGKTEFRNKRFVSHVMFVTGVLTKLFLQDTFLANSKLTEEEILKNAQYVQSLFKPAATGDFCG